MIQQMSLFKELDKKRTKEAVEQAFEQYRMCRYLTFEEREASLTQGYSDIVVSPTNVTSDQTASIAIYNTDIPAQRRAYCERIERAVARLHPKERLLIESRYMTDEYDGDYVRDYQIYTFVFDPPISANKYDQIRWRAISKLAQFLNIEVEKE